MSPSTSPSSTAATATRPLPPRGVAALGAADVAALHGALLSLRASLSSAEGRGDVLPDARFFAARERLVVDFASREELAQKLARLAPMIARDDVWLPLQAQGIYRGRGDAGGKLAFLFPGQGSQYAGMGRELSALDDAWGAPFAEADAVMRPWLDGALTARFLVDLRDAEAAREVDRALERAEILQPAVLATNTMLARALHRYGVTPDYVFGHSLGEYSALVEAGAISFAHALEMVSLLHPAVRDAARRCGGAMAVVMGAPERVSALLAELAPSVQLANVNSPKQCVIGGATAAVDAACQALAARGLEAARLPVTHAFHTPETTPIGEGMGEVVSAYGLRLPSIPVVAGATGELHPRDVGGMIDLLRRHPAATVLWMKGLETLFGEGVRTFVEVGPKKVLKGLADDVFAGRAEVTSLFSCHPKVGELASFNRALCGLYAAGFGAPFDA